jgi:puromycin-sensitive aminopeptidase
MNPYRLPQTVIPSRYDIRLEPDLAAARFTGEVRITVEVLHPVVHIVLNAAELAVHSAEVTGHASGSIRATPLLDEPAERLTLELPALLGPGAYVLRLTFTGTLNDKLRGFYRSRYKGPDGDWRWLAATQFEATDARRCFPCWDEPAFKAVFASTLVIDPALQAVSNTRIAAEQHEHGKKVIRFADTMPMSTYLVAYVVGELEASDAVSAGSTTLRVWCVPGKRHLTGFARAIGAASLKFFEEFYGRKYPGDKLDLIAIPDFAAGAMENLGAITFRETALLVDEAAATHAEKERVADVVAHENAHMWFGDLVTMSWWNGLWLNEAFATFMEMLAVDAWKPEWTRWTTFGVMRSAALTVDGLHSTRPIEFPVEAPRDADAMFDTLTYEKGASVLRMLEQYVGPEVFRSGVRQYLDRHAYGSTETADLWRALGDAARLPLPDVIDGWVFRPGYPLIAARTEGSRLVLSQRRFMYAPDGRSEPATDLWHVPIQVRVWCGGATEVRRLLLDGPEASLPLPGGWEAVLVNQGGHGFYRVRYEPELLERLLPRLPELEAIERFNLVNDAWAAVVAGLTTLPACLDLTARCRDERDRNVWSVLLNTYQSLSRIVDDGDRIGLEALVRDRVGPAASELGWTPRAGEDELACQLRADLLRALGTLGNDPATQRQAAVVFADKTADATLLSAAVPIVAHTGDAAVFDEFLRRFKNAKTPQEEQRYLLALAGFRDSQLIDRMLALTLSSDVRTQDAPLVLRAALLNLDARRQAWAFVRGNWARINRDFATPGLRRLCEGLVGLATPELERDVREFIAKNPVNLGGKLLEQDLELLGLAVRLREREGPALRSYFAACGFAATPR